MQVYFNSTVKVSDLVGISVVVSSHGKPLLHSVVSEHLYTDALPGSAGCEQDDVIV